MPIQVILACGIRNLAVGRCRWLVLRLSLPQAVSSSASSLPAVNRTTSSFDPTRNNGLTSKVAGMNALAASPIN